MSTRRVELRRELQLSVPVVVEVLASALMSDTTVKLQVGFFVCTYIQRIKQIKMFRESDEG